MHRINSQCGSASRTNRNSLLNKTTADSYDSRPYDKDQLSRTDSTADDVKWPLSASHTSADQDLKLPSLMGGSKRGERVCLRRIGTGRNVDASSWSWISNHCAPLQSRVGVIFIKLLKNWTHQIQCVIKANCMERLRKRLKLWSIYTLIYASTYSPTHPLFHLFIYPFIYFIYPKLLLTLKRVNFSCQLNWNHFYVRFKFVGEIATESVDGHFW